MIPSPWHHFLRSMSSLISGRPSRGRPFRKKASRKPRRHQPQLEALEDRTLLAAALGEPVFADPLAGLVSADDLFMDLLGQEAPVPAPDDTALQAVTPASSGPVGGSEAGATAGSSAAETGSEAGQPAGPASPLGDQSLLEAMAVASGQGAAFPTTVSTTDAGASSPSDALSSPQRPVGEREYVTLGAASPSDVLSPPSPNTDATVTTSSSSSASVPSQPLLNDSALLLIDFREITYFHNQNVLTSSDATIRANNNITGDFDPSLWPYDPAGGSGTTPSRGTLFRVYGFDASAVGQLITDADDAQVSYEIIADPEVPNAHYIDLGGPRRVLVPVELLQPHHLNNANVQQFNSYGTRPLTDEEKNVPGLQLSRNLGRQEIPQHIRDQLAAEGTPLVNAQGQPVTHGYLEYVTLQHWGHGVGAYREFIDVQLTIVNESGHGLWRLHDVNFDGSLGGQYRDFRAAEDAVRFYDVWTQTDYDVQAYANEDPSNQRVRENYAVPEDAVQILSTVNTSNDTLRLFFGTIEALQRRPEANADTASTDEGTPVTVAVLANDRDKDNDPLRIVSITSSVHGRIEVVAGDEVPVDQGMVQINPDGTITYTPDPDWYGVESFEYEISDGLVHTATALVTITVNEGDHPPVLQSIRFLPTGQGTTGDLSPDNPNGQGGRPAFGGGYRFFPDAASYATRTQSRNIVRIQAIVANGGAGVPVYFRSFDVDDPSVDATIDPNGNAGKDNRGIAAGANLDVPFPAPVGQGYQGRLRPVGGNFANEGDVVMVLTDAQGRAEVELATSFNPGDNFRVVVSLNQQEVQNLNDTTGVPTTGPIANFTGKATDQLSVWRRVHLEQDRMAAIPWQGPTTGTITAVAGVPGEPLLRELTTTLNIPQGNQFNGGSLRRVYTAAGITFAERYRIVSHTTGANSKVTIDLGTDLTEPAAGDPITLTQGDYQAGNTTAVGAPVNGMVEITTDQRFVQSNEYMGGILRIGGVNYHVVANTSDGRRPQDKVTILAAAAPAGGAFTIYQDDFFTTGHPNSPLRGEVTDHGLPAGGQVTITTNMNIPVANLFAGGILRAMEKTYKIISNTAGANATVTVATEDMLPVDITLYVALDNNVPATIVNPNANDAELYSMLQPTTVRAQNRYADAYLQPELNALNQFDSNNVTPTSHAPDYKEIADAYRGTSPGGPARPNDYETEFFWSVYVLTGFEHNFATDGDPDDEPIIILGLTSGGPNQKKEMSIVNLETVRDRFFNTYAPLDKEMTLAELKARVTVHEIGHQFEIAAGLPDEAGEHRNPPDYPPNIMQSDLGAAADGDFYPHPADIVALRNRIDSPGS